MCIIVAVRTQSVRSDCAKRVYSLSYIVSAYRTCSNGKIINFKVCGRGFRLALSLGLVYFGDLGRRGSLFCSRSFWLAEYQSYQRDQVPLKSFLII